MEASVHSKVFLLTLLIVLLFFTGCNSGNKVYEQLKGKENSFEDIIMYLNDSVVNHKKDTLLSLQSLKNMPPIAHIVSSLEKEGLLANAENFSNNCVYYHNKYSIIFFLRNKKTFFSNYDYLLIYQNLTGTLSGFGKIYHLNQDENINTLDIKVKQYTGLTDFVEVKYRKPFYKD